MSAPKPPRDPRGHSLRVYADIYDSAAFKCLSPHDVMAYLALLRELKGHNNGDLSLPLSRAKSCGISHHLTLARSLRALCAVGLIAITRKGGCAKGGQRLANLYRVTDRECYEIPAKHLTAMKATNEWKNVASIERGHGLIAAAEVAAKATHEKKALGHGVTATRTPRDVVSPKTRTPRDTWTERPGHGVTMAENPANPSPATVSAGFSGQPEKASHRTPRVPPLYIATPVGEMGTTQDHGNDDKAMAGGNKVNVTNARSARVAVWAHSGCAVPSPERLRRARAATLRRVGEPGVGNAERMKAAQAAAAQAIARHRTKPASTAPAGAAYDDDIVRERDQHVHDTTAWND